MPKRILFALQKGGVGKSTSTVAVAETLAATGYSVLVADLDSQGNATKMLTGKSIYNYTGKSIMEAIQAGDADPYLVKCRHSLDLLPAEDRLATFSRYIYTSRIEKPYATLQRLLAPIEDRYDFIFVDVGPSLGDTVINAIVYADEIIIPMDLGDLAMDAMVRFIEFVSDSREEGHTQAEIVGILLTMRDGRSRYERDISTGIRAAYGDLVFSTEIRRRVKIKEMSSTGVDLQAEAMEDYIAFTEELLDRISKTKEESTNE